MYYEEDYIPISALQHYQFCPRQCALIRIDNVWVENYLTAAGRVLHEKTEQFFRESRSVVVHEFGVEVASSKFQIFGQADVVEVHYSDRTKAEVLHYIPIEYKRGKEKNDLSDKVQLCAQAMCLEEMHKVSIDQGFLFYFATHKRLEVKFSEDLRKETIRCVQAVHQLYQTGETPAAIYKNGCKSCSLIEVCHPRTLGRKKSVKRYIAQKVKEEE